MWINMYKENWELKIEKKKKKFTKDIPLYWVELIQIITSKVINSKSCFFSKQA